MIGLFRSILDDEASASQHEAIDSADSFDQSQEVSADYETMDTDTAAQDDPKADDNSLEKCTGNANISTPGSAIREGRPSEQSTTAINQSPDTQTNDGDKDEMPLARGDKPQIVCTTNLHGCCYTFSNTLLFVASNQVETIRFWLSSRTSWLCCCKEISILSRFNAHSVVL